MGIMVGQHASQGSCPLEHSCPQYDLNKAEKSTHFSKGLSQMPKVKTEV